LSEEQSAVDKLMNTLITKMETMDNELQELRFMVKSPQALLRKAGFVPVNTPLSEDVMPDGFRGDEILKEASDSPDKYSNEEIHTMSWEDIHEMAEQYREVKELY